MPQAEFFGCYDFNDEWYLVEMVLNEAPSKIDWAGIVVPEEGVDNSCIALAIAASLSFSREGEPKYDTEEILCEFMELDKNGTDYCRIMKLYQALQEKSFGLVSRAG